MQRQKCKAQSGLGDWRGDTNANKNLYSAKFVDKTRQKR